MIWHLFRLKQLQIEKLVFGSTIQFEDSTLQ